MSRCAIHCHGGCSLSAPKARRRRYPGQQPAPTFDISLLHVRMASALQAALAGADDPDGIEQEFENLLDAALKRTPIDQVDDRFGVYPELLPLDSYYLHDLHNILLAIDD